MPSNAEKGVALTAGAAVQNDEGMEVQMLSGTGAVAFVLFASAMLVLLFFFLNHIFAITLVSTRTSAYAFTPFFRFCSVHLSLRRWFYFA